MDNVKLEVVKRYVDMVEKHKKESLEMTKELARLEMEDDAILETFYEVSDYNTALYLELEKAQRFYGQLVKRLLKEE